MLKERVRAGVREIGLDEELHFGHFTKIEEYREVNRKLVEEVFDLELLTNPFVGVDVGTGAGMVPLLVIEEMERRVFMGRVIGIDPNSDSLRIARETLEEMFRQREEAGWGGIPLDIEFIEGRGQDLGDLLVGQIPLQGVDWVSIHDAIHEIEGKEEKEKVLEEMVRILKSGGILTYNSAFTSAAYGEIAGMWGKWKMGAFRRLERRRNKKIKAFEIHDPSEYKEMICGKGLKIVHEALREVYMSKEALEAISRYPGFINGVFGDMEGVGFFSLKEKSDALVAAIADLGVEGLPRIWHEIIARKLPSQAV